MQHLKISFRTALNMFQGAKGTLCVCEGRRKHANVRAKACECAREEHAKGEGEDPGGAESSAKD